MPDLRVEPLSLAEVELIAALMDEEAGAWLRELDWDYSPIRRILISFLKQRLLPGFVLSSGRKAIGYTYFLTSRQKGVIGTLYASRPGPEDTAEQLLSRALETLQGNRSLQRIEAQIIPLNGLDVTPVFTRHGFQSFLRHYMELDLAADSLPVPPYPGTVVPWNPSHLLAAATVAHRSYRNGIDAVICEDYGSELNCENYLRSLVESPGCGIFQPDASFVGLDRKGTPCGFILVSRISSTSAMIPQISINPAHQGRGLGATLVRRVFSRLRSEGYKTVRLTVSQQNRRAYEWYLRLGFKTRRDFGAHLWKRE